MVYQEAGQHESAEEAYRRSLKIKVQRGDRPGEADTLLQLGNVYSLMGRWEEAVGFYRQAVEIDVEGNDLMNEGKTRTNLSNQLIKLRRYDEARQEILRAIECNEPFGHAAEPWKAFNVLLELDRAVGDDAAAVRARERAVQAFLAYRRATGENHMGSGRLATMVGQAIVAGEVEGVAAQLAELLQSSELPTDVRAVIPALQAILAGSRDPALASDPMLSYDGPVELTLLLEALASGEA